MPLPDDMSIRSDTVTYQHWTDKQTLRIGNTILCRACIAW